MHNYCETVRGETREICLVKQHKKYEITRTHVLHLICFSRLKDDLQDIHKMRKTCEARETREKKGCARDNVKINYTRSAIQLFYPLSHEKIPLFLA